MTASTTSLAELLSQDLITILNDEKRSIELASALEILSESVKNTDAYNTLMNAASDIRIQAEINLQALADDRRTQEDRARAIRAGVPAHQVWA